MSHGREETEFVDVGDDPMFCYWCGGEGWVQCEDPLQCTRPHTGYGECPCASCGGSGLAKDMTIW